MASYCMRISPATVMKDVQAKLNAFKTLYGKEVVITAKGWSITTTNKRDGILFPNTGVDVVKIGKQYITVKLPKNEGGDLLRVNMKNPNHGVNELVFLTQQ